MRADELIDHIERDLAHNVPCVRCIQVERRPDGTKLPIGERNNWSPQQIGDDRGQVTGNTFSIYLRHVPRLVVLDFDTLDVEGDPLWEMCCQRQYCRTKTNGGYHVYVLSDVPDGTPEKNIYPQKKMELLQRNVWEHRERVFEGEIMEFPWEELKLFLKLPSKPPTVRTGTFEELVSAACDDVRVPDEIARYVHDKCGAVVKAHLKPLSSGEKRKQRDCEQLELATQTHAVRVLREEGAITYVGIKKLAVTSTERIKALLDIANPDCCRNDWIRVGSYLKTVPDGFQLWSDWSKRSRKPSPRLEYEFNMLGGGAPCTMGSLVYLARQSDADAVNAWMQDAPADEAETDCTKHALDYPGVLAWNQRVAYIEETQSYLWMQEGVPPASITKDNSVTNNMRPYTDLKLADWLAHPDHLRYARQDYFPSLNPTPEQLPRNVYNRYTGMAIEREDAQPGDVRALLEHIHEILCAGNQEHSQYLLNCLAQIVQKPWERLNICIVMISQEGVGKSLLWSHFMAGILGHNFISCAQHDAILGQFGGATLSGKLLVAAEELTWGGHQGAGVLKDLLTSDVLYCNKKFCQPWTERSFINLVVNTNSMHAVPAGASARRFFVLAPSNRYSGVQSAASRAWFERVLKVDIKAFAHYLYTRDLTGFNSREVPLTEALTSQKQASMSAVEAALLEWLSRGWIVANVPWDETEPHYLPRSLFYRGARDEFGDSRGFPNMPSGFWAQLKKSLTRKDGTCLLQPVGVGRCSRTLLVQAARDTLDVVDGRRMYDRWFSLPSLTEVRNFWSDTRGSVGDW